MENALFKEDDGTVCLTLSRRSPYRPLCNYPRCILPSLANQPPLLGYLIVSLAYRILFPLRVPRRIAPRRAEPPPIPPTNTRVVVPPRLPLSRCSKPHHRPLQRTNIPGIIAAPTTARSACRSATLSYIVFVARRQYTNNTR